jgi:hypothetical protein
VWHSDLQTWTPHKLAEEAEKARGRAFTTRLPHPLLLTHVFAGPQYQSYDSVASFNSQNGRFANAGSETYYEKQGIPADREGRQMSHFFDISSLDENRRQAEQMKRDRQQMKGYDWKSYKEQKKAKRQKTRNAWLYEG